MKWKALVIVSLLLMLTTTAGVSLAAPAAPIHWETTQDGTTVGRVLEAEDASGPALYIVQLTDPPLASYQGGIEGLPPTSPSALETTKLDAQSPASAAYVDYLYRVQDATLAVIDQALGRSVEVAFRYETAFNGFAIEVVPEEAAAVAQVPGVVQVQREFLRYPLTDVGPQWMGADNIWSGSATGSPYQGEGVIVGIIDSGINLGHPSFAAVGGDGYVHTNPLGSGNYLGLCLTTPGTYACNDKTIGFYIHTGETTEDGDGHGSHTGSTAAGNYLQPGTVDLTPFDTYSPAISGVAPHANVIGYKACLDSAGCPLTALVSAINQATADGVDVINYSIGGGTSNPWNDSDSLAFLAAQDAGIVPVTSAGNSGPDPSTIGSPADAPWLVSVGASTHNRASNSALINMSGGGTPPADINGKGFAVGYGPAPIVYAGDFGDAECLSAFAPGTWTNGEIVVCDRGTIARVAKGWNVLQGGAGGYVLANSSAGESINGDVHHLPALQITYDDGVILKNWLASGSGHMATIAGTSLSFSPANGDLMAGFSSRGPLINTAAEVIKPDVTAPGVDILAAYRDFPPDAENPTRNYGVVSGTSMSSPHTAGAAALLRGLHPSWTPAEIKSALMSTAATAGVVKEDGLTPADPFDMGGGSVRVDQAAQAGLVLSVAAGDFQAANPATGGDPKNLNLASMANNDCAGTCSWTRTVKATTTGSWTASGSGPTGLTVAVSPSSFSLTAGQTQVLTITADVSGLPLNQWAFGQVLLQETTQAVPEAHLPVAVVATSDAPIIDVNPSSLRANQPPDTSTMRSLSISNEGVSGLEWNIFEEASSTAFQLVDWFEDFDSYATGASLQGVGGWKGWGNDSTLAPLTSGAQARSTPNSVEIAGDADLVQEYTGYDTGFWTYTAWQYVPSSFSGESYFILLNQYDDAGASNNWSVQVRFDATAGQVIADGVGSTFPPLPLITGRWVELRVEIDLVNDVQTFYYDGQMLYSGSWANGVSGGGITSIGAADLFANEASTIFYDDMSLVAAEGGFCSTPSDIPWASVDPSSGSTAPGGTSTAEVTFDSTGLVDGTTYEGTLCVESNDPDRPLVPVPLTLEVSSSGFCQPGQTQVNVYFSDLELDNGGWTVAGFADWEWGTPVSGIYEICDTTPRPEPGGAYSGNNVWANNLNGCYINAGDESLLISQTFDFSALSAPIEMSWWNWYEIFTSFDMAEVYVNGDRLFAVSSSTATDDWQQEAIDLSAYAGQSNVTVTFRLYATTVVNRMGWYVDDISIDGCVGEAELPNIEVDPLSIEVNVDSGQSTDRPLNIGNTGTANLTWMIEEEETTSSPRAALTVGDASVAAEVGDASVAAEVADPNEVPGKEPQSAPERSPWAWPDVVLYDNGPLVNGFGTGVGGADESILQNNSLGMDTLGFGNQVSAGFRIADDFTVSDPRGWHVDTITFFGYQTGSSTASTFTAVNLQIWDGPPNDPGSSVVFGNTTTNRLTSSTWSNIYRAAENTSGTASTRPIMANTVAVGTYLPAGTYWLDWVSDGTLTSGPWAPPITINGQATTGNALQYNSSTSTWSAVIDGGSNTPQGFPFIMEDVDCLLPSEIPWLTLSQTSGTTAPANATEITVFFDASGLSQGTYTGNLCVTSNDPDPGPGNETDLVIVPVTMVVGPPAGPRPIWMPLILAQ